MHHEMSVFGTATVGTKGQIVIPNEARETLGLTPGDKVLVIGGKNKCLVICPMENMRGFLDAQQQQLTRIQNILKNEKDETK